MMSALKGARGEIRGTLTCRVLDHRRNKWSLFRVHEFLIEDPDGGKHWIGVGDTLTLNVLLEVRPT